jgi:hypothetical protein
VSTTKRIIVSLVQLFAATIIGYLAGFLTVMALTLPLEIALIFATVIGAGLIYGIGRLFGLWDRFLITLAGAAIGAALGFGVTITGLGRNLPGVLPVLMLIPGLFGVIAYHWNSREATANSDPR